MNRELQCPVDWARLEHSIGDELTDCGVPCNIFLENERKMAAIVVSVVGVSTLISSMFTIITAMLDPSRFQYPERAIVHLAVCYALLAIGYIVGVSYQVLSLFINYLNLK